MYSFPQCRGLAPLTASITNPCKQRMKFSCDTFFNVYRLRQQEHCNEFLIMCIACASLRNTVTSFLDMTSKKAPALKLKRRCFRVHRLLPLIGFHQQGEPYCSPIGLSFPTRIFTLFCCTIHVICFLNVLLHYERNSILLGKGFNIAVCRTVDGEVVATVKIFFVINTG